jgi:hypothetical protein
LDLRFWIAKNFLDKLLGAPSIAIIVQISIKNYNLKLGLVDSNSQYLIKPGDCFQTLSALSIKTYPSLAGS